MNFDTSNRFPIISQQTNNQEVVFYQQLCSLTQNFICIFRTMIWRLCNKFLMQRHLVDKYLCYSSVGTIENWKPFSRYKFGANIPEGRPLNNRITLDLFKLQEKEQSCPRVKVAMGDTTGCPPCCEVVHLDPSENSTSVCGHCGHHLWYYKSLMNHLHLHFAYIYVTAFLLWYVCECKPHWFDLPL